MIYILLLNLHPVNNTKTYDKITVIYDKMIR